MIRNFFTNDKNPQLDAEIDAVLQRMHNLGVDSAEYPKMMDYLERLISLKAKERHAPVSRDTIALIFGGLLQTLVIVAYEHTHVITSKAINQVIRPR